jgi:hypothetical protein
LISRRYIVMEPVDHSTALFYKMSKENNGNTLFVLAELDGNPSERYIVNHIENIITCFPILSKILIEHDQGFEWKNHTITDICDHFTYIEKQRYDKRNFHRYINALIEKDFAEGQPEWEFSLLTYEKSNKTFLIFKSNHIYGDGHQISHYLKLFMDNPEIKYPKIKKRTYSLFNKVYAFLMTWIQLIYVLLFFRRKDISFDKKGAHLDKARFLHCHTRSLEEVRKIKEYYGVSINDLYFTIITQAIREYCGKDISLSSLSMFNLRNLSSFSPNKENTAKEQNNIGFISLSKKITGDATNNLLNNSTTLSYFKSSPFIYCIVEGVKYISKFSPTLSLSFLRYLGGQSTFGFSNFRAFSEEKSMNGCRVTNISNFVVPYRVGSLFTLVSYCDNITLNVTFRERNITDQKKFLKCIDDVYCQLKDKAIGW